MSKLRFAILIYYAFSFSTLGFCQNLNEADFLKKTDSALKSRDWNSVILFSSKVIQLNPNDPELYLSRGLAFYNREKHQEAIADYTKVIELMPKYPVAYLSRGLAFYKFEKHKEAIADYTKAIELNPKNSNAHSNRGIAYKAIGKNKEAEQDFLKAKEIEKK